MPLVGNDDIVLSTAVVTEPMDYFFRNASGDEMLFVQAGDGVLESSFGVLEYRAHDYVYVPMGTTYKLQPRTPTTLFVAESSGQITIPRKFRNEFGQLAEHAPYYERDFRAPVLQDPVDAVGEFDVRVTAKGRHAKYVVANHPFDVVGWDGFCYPFAFNAHDYMPITGKIHQPPSSHQIWDAPGAAFILFAPRMFDYHPLAVPAPYNHSSVDCDEIIYYASGNFMSRRGIEEQVGDAARRRRAARPAARRGRSVARQSVHRRARGRDRRLRPAARRRNGERRGGRAVLPELGRAAHGIRVS